MTITLNGIRADNGDPFDTYRAIISDIFEAHRPNPQDPFSSDVRASIVGEMFLHRGFHSAAGYDRPMQRLRRDGHEDIAILAIQRGSYEFSIGDSEGKIGAGQALVIDRTKPLFLKSTDNIQATLNIPRALARDMLGGNPAHGRILGGRSGALLTGFLSTVGTVGSAGKRTEEALHLLLQQAIGTRVSEPRLDRFELQGAKDRAMAMMSEHLADPDLDIEAICRAIGVSRSNLYRAFAGQGIYDTLRALRLDRARAMMREDPSARIALVAERCGFANASVFSTQFRKRFGVSPSKSRFFPDDNAYRNDGTLDARIRMARWYEILGSE